MLMFGSKKIAPDENFPPDNCSPDNGLRGKLSPQRNTPRTIARENNCPRGN